MLPVAGLRGLPRRDLLRCSLLSFFPFAAKADSLGRVYVYAKRSTPARSWLPIFCGGVAVAALKEGRFFAVMLPAGRYTFSIEDGVPLSIEVGANRDRYLRLDWNHHIGRPPIPALSSVSPEQAHQEMKYLSYIEPKRSQSPSVPERDPREPPPRLLKQRDNR